jgi:choline kinase
MMGIVLAAGLGSRLKGEIGVVKLSYKIAGLPLICYPIISLAAGGVDRLLVVSRGSVLHVIGDQVSYCSPSSIVRVVESTRWWMGSGFTLVDGLGWVERFPVVVSTGDHIYEPMLVEKLVSECDAPFCIAGDRSPRLVDISEATLIMADSSGRVVRLGKGLAGWTYVDTGVHLVNFGILYEECKGIPFELNDLKNCMARYDLVKVVDVTGALWIDIDSVDDLRRLESRLGSMLLKKIIELDIARL